MQLERILQSQGFGTRKACRALIRAGRVSLVAGGGPVLGQVPAAGQVLGDGVATTGLIPCESPFAEVETDGLIFAVDGQEWPYCEFARLLLHKPAGYECSRKPQHHPSVLELLPAPLRERGVQPIGRLDADTSGLLLITDDGQLNHRLSSARRKVPKIYRVTTRHPVTAEQVAALLAGVQLHDEPVPLAAAARELLADCLLRLTVTEGKYHQIKRMVAAAGNRVEALHREAIGGLWLPDDLPPGAWRWLGAVDLEKLGNSSGAPA